MRNIWRIRDWRSWRRTIAATAAVSLTALPASPANATAPPPNLVGESLSARVGGANPADDHGSFTVVSRNCDANGTSTISFVASGPATGPYRGTFTADGTATIGPQHMGSVPPFLEGPIASFELSFAITPDPTDPAPSFVQVTATERFIETATEGRGRCQDFDPPFFSNASNTLATPVRLAYDMRIDTGGATWSDSGQGYADLQATTFTDGHTYGALGLSFIFGHVPQPLEDRDGVPPTLTTPPGVVVEATSPNGEAVAFSVTAVDNRDPNPIVSCMPNSGSTFALGSTVVTCTATDATGNTSSPASFVVSVVDTTAPTLVVPGSVAIDATSPSGTVATYAASAADLVDPSPTISCSPPAGGVFPIGDTIVTCTAVDASGNRAAPRTFTLHVKAAAEQISGVVAAVKALDAKQGIVESLDAKLQNVLDALSSASAGDKASACNKLDAFIKEVQAQTGKALTQTDADRLIADARRIRVVIGCA